MNFVTDTLDEKQANRRTSKAMIHLRTFQADEQAAWGLHTFPAIIESSSSRPTTQSGKQQSILPLASPLKPNLSAALARGAGLAWPSCHACGAAVAKRSFHSATTSF
eukprot:6207122-Pleurochrysis_carterae.AAC.1